jgi:hypothetical protein
MFKVQGDGRGGEKKKGPYYVPNISSIFNFEDDNDHDNNVLLTA